MNTIYRSTMAVFAIVMFSWTSAMAATKVNPSQITGMLLGWGLDDLTAPEWCASGTTFSFQNVQIVSQGKWGNCAFFDSNSRITCSGGDNFNSDAGTIMFWFKPTWEGYDVLKHVLVQVCFTDGKWMAIMDGVEAYTTFGMNYCSNIQASFPSAEYIQVNEWVHIAITWQDGEQSVVYINGEPKASWGRWYKSATREASEIMIGSNSPMNGSCNGYIDELYIFNRQLSGEEIRASYYFGFESQQDYDARIVQRTLDLQTPASIEPSRTKPDGTYLETRAVFVTPAIYDSAQTDDILDQIEAANFNTIIPEAYNWQGRAYWPSSIVTSIYGNTDVLGPVIQKAHQRGMKVWAQISTTWRDNSTHPVSMALKYLDGTPSTSINCVHNQGFVQMMGNLMYELVSTYPDLDGVTFDYIRTRDVCYSQECKDAYSQLYGRDLVQDSIPVNMQWRPEFIEWQEKGIRELIQVMRDGVRDGNSNIPVSGFYAQTFFPGETQRLANWQGNYPVELVNAGLLDFIHLGIVLGPYEDYQINGILSSFNDPTKVIAHVMNYDQDANNGIIGRDALELSARFGLARDSLNVQGVSVYAQFGLTSEQITGWQTWALDQNAECYIIPMKLWDDYQDGDYQNNPDWTIDMLSDTGELDVKDEYSGDYDLEDTPGQTKYFTIINAHSATESSTDKASKVSVICGAATSTYTTVSLDFVARHNAYNDLFFVTLIDFLTGRKLTLKYYVGGWPRASVIDENSNVLVTYSQPDIRGSWHHLDIIHNIQTGDFDIKLDGTSLTIYSGSQHDSTPMSQINGLQLWYTSRQVGSSGIYYQPATSSQSWDWQYWSMSFDNIQVFPSLRE